MWLIFLLTSVWFFLHSDDIWKHIWHLFTLTLALSICATNNACELRWCWLSICPCVTFTQILDSAQNWVYSINSFIRILCVMGQCGMCSITDGNGTASELFTSKHWSAGTYRLHFGTSAYFRQHGMETLYPHVDVSIIFTFRCFGCACGFDLQ